MYYILLILTGGVIATMVGLNGALSQNVGFIPSLVIIHLVGFVVSSCMVFCLPNTSSKTKAKSDRPPRALYSSGMLGVFIAWANIYSVLALGISCSLALRLLGQLLGSFLIDLTGLLGFEKRAISPDRLITLILACVGCVLMMDVSLDFSLSVWVAIGSGVVLVLSSVMNASLGTYIGLFPTVKMNFLTGLITTLPMLFWIMGDLSELSGQLANTNLLILFGGGVSAVILVAGIAKCLPHVSILVSTICLFLGQLIFGLAIDSWIGNLVSSNMIAGGSIIAIGVSIQFIRSIFERIKQTATNSSALPQPWQS